MFGTPVDTWLRAALFALALASALGLTWFARRMVLRHRRSAARPARRPRTRSYPTVPASEQTGDNLRLPLVPSTQRAGALKESR